ncbi:WD40 repeat-like protein [Exidia glandulosa HHB12029]|uniref:WD40 repeat-like protein n=1 Tax=Exidia glandulosa HHB12029 TaxID=1314781 RepID=A0A165KDC5_EXIGL|nr:WD40 repeat-like protein [Exidia glandulosa HHB12029]
METEATFVAPEGVYSVTEEHKPQILQLTSNSPSPYPTRLSTVTIKYAAKPGGQGLSGLLGRQDKTKDKDKVEPDRASLSSSDNANDDAAGSNDSSADIPKTHAFTGPSLFASQGPAAGGKRKNPSRPRNNMKTTSSAFVTRHQTAEGLHRTLASKHGDVTYVFFNQGKSIFWSEVGIRAKDPLARITFSAYPTCHDINMETVAPDRLDVIIGFSTGDLIWFDAISSRYARLNKQGCITSSPCTSVRWVPRSAVLFLVSHADGTILVYDSGRDDGSFTPVDPDASIPSSLGLPKTASTHSQYSNGTNLEPGTGASSQTSSILPSSATAASDPQSWDPLDDILVSKPPWHPAMIASADSRKVAVKNPLSHWRVSRRGVLGLVFSPDVQYVAVACEDGCLRIIDALNERLMDTYASYFGAFTCVDWSPDGRFVLTGGQDDLVTVISPWDQRIVARCQGHSSFISSVGFDQYRCDGRTYRFGSVGEDSKLILWDFSSGALHRPKMSLSHHQRMSLSSTLSLVRRHPIGADPSTLQLQLPQNGETATGRRFHAAPGRSEVAVVQPVLTKHVEGETLTSVAFLPMSLLTGNKAGLVKVWVRPLAVNKPQRIPRQR